MGDKSLIWFYFFFSLQITAFQKNTWFSALKEKEWNVKKKI